MLKIIFYLTKVFKFLKIDLFNVLHLMNISRDFFLIINFCMYIIKKNI